MVDVVFPLAFEKVYCSCTSLSKIRDVSLIVGDGGGNCVPSVRGSILVRLLCVVVAGVAGGSEYSFNCVKVPRKGVHVI